MNAKELREAAILLHDWCFDSTIKYQDCEHPWDAHLNDFDLDDAILKALEPVLAHILANVQEDGEEKITDEWLSSIGGEVFEYENDHGRCYCFHMDNDVTLNIEVSSRAYLWDVGNDHIVCELKPITTRSQFRNLTTGLGIEPQKIS